MYVSLLVYKCKNHVTVEVMLNFTIIIMFRNFVEKRNEKYKEQNKKV